MIFFNIILATYNGEKYIGKQLESILKQTYQEYKIYIHDDGSKDRTMEICKQYMSKYPNKIEIWEYAVQGGANLNFMSMLSRSPHAGYIVFCDQDDLWDCNKLFQFKEVLSKRQDTHTPLIAYSDLQLIDGNGKEITASYLKYTKKDPTNINLYALFINGFIPGCCCVINQRLRDLMCENINVNNVFMHDWWAFLVNEACNGDYVFVDLPLVSYRQHGSNTIGAKKTPIANRIITNLAKIFQKDFHVQKITRIEHGRKMTKELLSISCVDSEKKVIIKEYAYIENKNKLRRIVFSLRYFHNVKNIWGLILWV